MLCRFQRPDAAAQLDFHIERPGNLADRRQIDRVTGPRAIQVNNMQPLRACFDPAPRRIERIFGKHRLAVKAAFFQTDTFATTDIYRRKYYHIDISLKFAKIFRPTALDFSGWNWTAWTRPRPTAAVTCPP